MTTQACSSDRVWWPVCAAAMYLVVLLAPWLGYYGLWFDEVFSVVMSKDFSSIVRMVQTQENNMLLHYLLLRMWMPLGDGSEFFLRSLSLLLAVLALWPLYAGARALAGDRVAAIASFVYASHYLVLQHAPSCRGYALTLLISALTFWWWVKAWQAATFRCWILVGFMAGLGVWAHYFGALLPPVLLAAMLWRDGWQQPWRKLVCAATAFVVTALPVLLTRPPDGAAQIAWANAPTFYSVKGTMLMLLGVDGLREIPLLYAVLASCLVAMGWRCWRAGHSHDWRSPVAGLAVGLLLVVLAVLVESLLLQPLFVARFFTPLVPVYCVVLGVALAHLWRWLAVVAIAAMMAVSAHETLRYFTGEIFPVRFLWKPVVQQMLAELRSDDLIMVYPTYMRMPVDYYLDRLDVQHRFPRPSEYASSYYRQGGGVEPEPDWQRVRQWSMQQNRIWLLTEGKQNESWARLNRRHAPALRDILQERCHLFHDYSKADFVLQRYDCR